jgi:hypothetical protein
MGVIRKRERGHAHACLWLCAARHALVCRTPFMLDPNIASSDQHRLLRVVSRQQRRESRRITCNCLPVSPVAGPCSQREHAELTSNHCKPRLTKPNKTKARQVRRRWTDKSYHAKHQRRSGVHLSECLPLGDLA